MMESKTKIKMGIISGYFNPIHMGHIEYIQGAIEQCELLTVIINNDYQVALKGAKKFMDENHRKNILQNIKGVTEAIISLDSDITVCKTLEELYKFYHEKFNLIFFNSGDRDKSNSVSSEIILCNELGIEYQYIPRPKLYSSSEILKNK
jgi:cytidyltransferase-like protein